MIEKGSKLKVVRTALYEQYWENGVLVKGTWALASPYRIGIGDIVKTKTNYTGMCNGCGIGGPGWTKEAIREHRCSEDDVRRHNHHLWGVGGKHGPSKETWLQHANPHR